MNPLLIKIGISVVASAAAYFFLLWINNRSNQESSLVHINSGNYDGSNISNCCICLIEFTLLRKNAIISLPCRHKICKACCTKLLSYQIGSARKCPQCRHLIPESFVSSII